MRDEMNRNALAVTGTPSLVTGALTIDSDQALSFNGPTSSASAADSASLSITGSLSVEFFVKVAAYPGAEANIIVKNGSYIVNMTTTGRLIFYAQGASSSANVTSNASLALNTWYHIVCVYDGGYSGAQQFGEPTIGGSLIGLEDDDGNNKIVSKFTLLETALLNGVNIAREYTDEIYGVQACGVVYSDSAGSPDTLVAASPVTPYLYPPTPAWRSWTWVRFPLATAVPPGDYHIGCVTDTFGPPSKTAIFSSSTATGGVTSRRNDSVSSPSNPFGSVTSLTTDRLSAYCDYTAVARTSNEGKVLIYINGAKNVSASYSGGIADSANALLVTPSVAAQVDEISVWNRALTPVQIATHYNAH